MPTNFAAFISTHQWVIILAVVWTLPWKGVALWRAARNQSVAWFIILLIVNTLGILEIIYIFIFSKRKDAPQQVEAQETRSPEKKIIDIKVTTKPDLDDPAQKS